MAGKMWCCGGGSSGGGSGGGLAAVATTDTATVDFTGDGTAGAPLSADVILAPAPNGLQETAGGLLVAPSADAGNTLTIGADGRLFVPAGTPTVVQGDGTTATVTGSGTAGDPYVVHSIAGGTPTVVQAGTNVTVTGTGTAGDPYIVSATDPTTVTGLIGSAPVPVGTSRSVDVDVTPNGSGGFQVGARLSPVWQQGLPVQVGALANNVDTLLTQLIVPEDGIYYMEAVVEGIANVTSPVSTADRWVIGTLKVDGVVMRGGFAVLNRYTLNASVMSRAATSTVTHPWRARLNAGQAIQAWAIGFADAIGANDGFGAIGTVGYHKIAD